MRIKILLVLLLFSTIAFGQQLELKGKVIVNGDAENIHIINKTSQKYTTTNTEGEFKITAKLNDTLIFSSIRYKQFSTIINQNNITNKQIYIKLEEQVNELDEVVVGKILTGDLSSDIDNNDTKPEINFYDVGIPGYKGKPLSQNERRLYEAGEFKPKQLLGLLGGGLPLNPILNGISGRTKTLKQRVKLESDEELLQSIQSRLSKEFFSQFPLEESKRMEFFYFCSDDENFQSRCKNKSDIEVFEFLKEKYNSFIINLKN